MKFQSNENGHNIGKPEEEINGIYYMLIKKDIYYYMCNISVKRKKYGLYE